MSQVARLKKQIEDTREMSEGMLKAFETPEQWTYQVHPTANHALWFAGHMAVADNFFISVVAPDKGKELVGFDEKFGMGSKPDSDPAAYPPPAEVLDAMRERRRALLAALDGLSDDDLTKPTPEGSPEMFTDLGSIFELTIRHEAMHLGQVTIGRRALGNEPLFGASPEEAAAN